MLRSANLKATPGRLALLKALGAAKEPLGIPALRKKLGAKEQMDTVTIYRALEALRTAGLIRLADLRHGHQDYELARSGEHHHHLVCEGCGVLEAIPCPVPGVEGKVPRSAKGFARLSDHAFELFGTCNACA